MVNERESPENSGGLFETDAMLGPIPSRFVSVPFKCERHRLVPRCCQIRACSSEDGLWAILDLS